MPTLPVHFEAVALLGRGGMGEVWRVRHQSEGRELALKLCLAPDAEGRLLFRQEHWAMATLQHPALVPALEYGETDERVPYFTMPIVEGVDASPGMTEEAVCGWLPGVASALDFLHGRGFVHGDIKPENLRVLPDGTARLMDLGLLKRAGRPGPISGTLAYVAPEVALGRPLDGRTDLYMLGAVLFELLAGRPPFRADSTDALLRAHVETPAPRLRDLGVKVSVELDTAVAYLLAKDPAARFPNGQALLAALGLEAVDDGAQAPWGPPLIGRDALQARLDAWLQASEAAAVVVIEGAPGMGRSRLLDETHAAARVGGRRSLLAAGLGGDAAPYSALAPWLQTLWDEASPEQRELLGPLLSAGLPALAPLAARPLDAAAERARFMDAVARLAAGAGPGLLVCLDDADRLDADSAALLEYLRSRGEEAGWRWLVATEAPLEEGFARGAVTERLLPLGDADSLQVASAMLGGTLPEPVAQRVGALAEGVPGQIVALIQYWAQTGALVRRQGQWHVPSAQDLVLPPGEHALADWALQRLEGPLRALATQAALLGERGALADLEALSHLPAADFFAGVAELEAADILLVGRTSYRFVRPAQAARLISALSPAERTAGHRAVAAYLIRAVGLAGRVAGRDLAGMMAIARHLLSSGDGRGAFAWVEASARICLARGSMLAVAPLVKALAAEPTLDDQGSLAVAGLEVYLLRHEGAIDEAIARYEGGLLDRFRAQGAQAASEHLVTYASLLQQKGRYEPATVALQVGHGLAQGGGLWATAVRAEFFLGRIAYFGGEPRRAIGHIEGAIATGRRQGLASMLPPILSLAGFITATEVPGDRPRAFKMMEEAIDLARADGNLYDTADALSNLGNALMAVGDFRAAQSRFAEYLVLCDRLALPTEATFAHLNLAATALELGDTGGGKRHADRALALARPQGRRFPEGFAVALGGLIAVHQGQPDEGLAQLQAGLDLAREIKNRYLASQILALQAEAALLTGQLELAAALVAERQASGDASDHDEQAARMARVQAGLEATLQPEALLQRVSAEPAEAPAVPGQTAHRDFWAGAAALRLGWFDQAERHLQRAARLAQLEGLRQLAGEVALLRALVAESVGSRPAAARFAAAALEAGRQAGAFLLRLQASLVQSRLPGGDQTTAREARAQLASWVARLPEAGRDAALSVAARDLALAEAPLEGGDEAGLSGWLLRLTAQLTREALMAEAVQGASELLEPEAAFLVLCDADSVRRIVASGSASNQQDEFVGDFAREVLAAGEERQTTQHTVPGQPPRHLAGVPVGEGRAEVLVVRFSAAQGAPSARRLSTLGTLARQTGILFGQREAQELAATAAEARQAGLAAALKVLHVQDLASRLSCVAAEALAVTGAERMLWLRQPDGGGRLVCDGAYGAGGVPLEDEWQMYTKGVTRRAVVQRKATFVCDVQQEEDFRDRGSVRALGMRSVFVVPVQQGEALLGVLYLDQQHMVAASEVALARLEAIAEVWAAVLAGAPASA
ncbi:MAG: AAA family ATPase [Candidatus Sericytochromatia bacterium]|nr:AAA family ATPase [Candidatus Sericytochromatia bacterium]